MTSQGAGRPFGINEIIEAYRACKLYGSLYIAPSKGNIEVLTGIKDGDQAIFRYIEWEEPVMNLSIEATGSGEISIYLDNEKEPSGRLILENGHIIASSFEESFGKHEIIAF